jgi:hypothetical protein
MDQLFQSLLNFLSAGWEVVISLIFIVAPWSPLIAWIVFWLFAVNWEKLYLVATKGALYGVILIGLMMILVWGLISPPPAGYHNMIGLHVGNFVGKTIYVTMLFAMALMCGSVQLSGALGSLAHFPDEEEHSDGGHESDHGGHEDHGHGHSAH